jgi:hypothetical protein
VFTATLNPLRLIDAYFEVDDDGVDGDDGEDGDGGDGDDD